MIDIRFIRNNPEIVRQAIIDKNEKADLDKLLELDEAFRKEQYEFEGLRAHQNTVSQEIAKKKRAKEDASSQLEEMTKLAARIKDIQASLAELGAERDEILLSIPNIPEESVPVGKDESANE
ncbi:MAG TPA: serine--tRNA ligase, partial [Candidatus Cloacimonetes bacterium]|nr:serine--tRNA ligase [Candidatus Cloacimonadota bacterium]